MPINFHISGPLVSKQGTRKPCEANHARRVGCIPLGATSHSLEVGRIESPIEKSGTRDGEMARLASGRVAGQAS